MTEPNNPDDLPKAYEPAAAQQRWYEFWERNGYFHSEPDADRQPFTIVIPPPNVTGALHLGHALNNSLQDIIVRFKRMQGYNALWMPGTDHAGIATQAVVERRLLEEEGKSRHDLGREALVERIWAWKDQYEARILGQLKRMGCSCDWQRTRFTLDELCARAVRHTFFRMFKDGLIYRGKRLVNWDTFLQTAVSDDEVFHETVEGHFWHFRYPVIDPQPSEPIHVTIATTRPETMLGDTAVAVHPDPAAALDKAEAELKAKLAAAPQKEQGDIEDQLEDLAHRRKHVLPVLLKLRDMAAAGRKLMLPLLDRPIPLIADEWAKPQLGSGCVKITPAHDPNDYEVGQRHAQIGSINILNPDGTLNDNAGPYRGQKILQARENVAADLDELGLLEGVEDRQIDLAHSDRSKTPIEPYLADQWFVRMEDLAQSAMDAVSDGRVKITPPRYARGYLDWLSEKRDWCISRNLWWGHQIPVWQVTLQANRYQGANTTLRDSLRRVQSEFVAALDEFAQSCGRRDEITASPSEKSETIFYICARTQEAEDELNCFYRRHHRARMSKLYDTDPPIEPDLSQSDPRYAPDRELWDRIAIMNSQDPDVLDTWFSSALWPHSTLGWPSKTPELEYYYPTSLLITSRDIITLWVARMVLSGLYNMGEVPFRQVYIHPKILDGYGESMSKSKGNGVDPLDVIDKFGADALRFALAHLTTESQDVRMPVEFECPHCGALIEQTRENRILPKVRCTKCKEHFSTQWAQPGSAEEKLPRGAVVSERFELGRNFCNKLWNAARFALMNLDGFDLGPIDPAELRVEDRWILSRLSSVSQTVTAALDEFRFADAARALYDFAWDEFCSFYIEMLKDRLQQDESKVLAQRMLAHTLDVLMRLLHPIIPFLAEEVWQALGNSAQERGFPDAGVPAESIMLAPWPTANPEHQDAEIEDRFARFQEVLRGIRDVRSRQNIAPRTTIHFAVRCEEETVAVLEPMTAYFRRMAGAEPTGWGPDVEPPALSANFTARAAEVYVDLAEHIDLTAEIERKGQELDKLAALIRGKEAKLANESFTSRAPADVVEREREALDKLTIEHAAVTTALEALVTARGKRGS